MHILQQILFLFLLLIAIRFFAKRVVAIWMTIHMGKEEEYNDRPAERWKNVFLLALGQKKMFRKPLVAIMHLIIYAGFIIINVEVLEIVLDGILGRHRLFSGFLGSLYPFLINSFEYLAIGVILVCIGFLARRNILKLKRFRARELAGWPASDANYILIAEIILMTLFLCMNASDTLLQERGVTEYAKANTGNFHISQFIQPLFSGLSDNGLIVLERVCWWLHIAGIFAFLNYLPYSKHLHILLAFPNAYYTRLESKGKMKNMPEIQQEVLYAMQPELAPAESTPPAKFGAKDVVDLSWRNLLDAYACTECGRCSAACPATLTGKLLSPRKIMMDTRDRSEEIQKNNYNVENGRTLLHDFITTEELRACTSCNACVEECPVSISPLEIILELRRSLVMEESNAPQEWNAMFGNVENNFAPWKFSPDERDAWVNDR